jgi:hypothetical protein
MTWHLLTQSELVTVLSGVKLDQTTKICDSLGLQAQQRPPRNLLIRNEFPADSLSDRGSHITERAGHCFMSSRGQFRLSVRTCVKDFVTEIKPRAYNKFMLPWADRLTKFDDDIDRDLSQVAL